MRTIPVIACAVIFLVLLSCNTTSKPKEEATPKVSTPVTVSTVTVGSISRVIHLTASSTYLKKNMVRSVSGGYITKSSCFIGEFVNAGSSLFSIKTKEAEALDHYAKNNPEFAFNGEMIIKAPTSGIVTEVTKQANDYVADGDQLCIIAEQSSLVFLLNVPFEQNRYATIGTRCAIFLPDSTRLQGTIISKLSAIDQISQTQSFVVKANTSMRLPENLLATVELIERTKENTQIADKRCILTDETMDNFWVMKLINDSTAVKVLLKPGIVTDTQIEIISPLFSKDDRLIISGHYGLADTAMVNIIRPKP